MVKLIGPTDSKSFDDNLVSDLSLANWSIKDYEIDKIWKYTKGKNVKVAIIDTGLNFRHSNILNKKNIGYFNIFSQSTDPYDCIDNEGHGSHCAGIVAAHGPDIFGVAPASDLLIIKATINGSLDCKNLALAINQAVRLGADIISVSYEFFNSDPDFGLLDNAVTIAGRENIMIVACSGNGGNSHIFSDTYPASFLTCIGVGSSDENKNLWKKTTLNYNIDILAPGADIKLMDKNGGTTVTDSGTSYAAPYIAGVCALMLSYSKKKNLDFIRNILKTKSSNKNEIEAQIRQYYGDPHLKIANLGIVSPFSSFNSLNT